MTGKQLETNVRENAATERRTGEKQLANGMIASARDIEKALEGRKESALAAQIRTTLGRLYFSNTTTTFIPGGPDSFGTTVDSPADRQVGTRNNRKAAYLEAQAQIRELVAQLGGGTPVAKVELPLVLPPVPREAPAVVRTDPMRRVEPLAVARTAPVRAERPAPASPVRATAIAASAGRSTAAPARAASSDVSFDELEVTP